MSAPPVPGADLGPGGAAEPAEPAGPAPGADRGAGRGMGRGTGRWADRRLRVITRLLLATGSGLALAVSFPPWGLSWLGVPAVAALTAATVGVRARTGALLGLLQGLVFFGVLVRWLAVVGTDAWVLLAGFCALWIAAVGAATAALSRLRAWPLWVACAWVLQEALRDRIPLGGFPWGRLAFGQTSTWLTPYAALGGAPLVTFASALAGTLLAFAVIGRGRWSRLLAAVGSLLVALLGLLVPLPVAGQSTGGPAEATVAVVQGNVPSSGLGAFGDARQVLDNHVRRTIALAADVQAGRVPAPDLVIWPENASDLDPYLDPSAQAAIDTAVKAIGVPVLVGAVIEAPADPDRVLNVGIVWDPVRGPGERYAKVHPVPFGEYVPFRAVLARLIDRFALVPRDFAPGATPGVLEVGPVRLGDVICFEVAYDEIVRAVIRGAGEAGGRLLVVQTNNATYAGTGQPEQQLAMSRLRAVEHGRAVVVAATSGISAVLAPDGSIRESAAEGVAATLVTPVPLRDDLSWADRGGYLVEWLLAGLAAAALAWAVVSRRRTAARVRRPARGRLGIGSEDATGQEASAS